MCGNLYAGVLPDDVIKVEIDNPSGGLQTDIASHNLTPKFSPYMRNVFIDQGSIMGINGYQIIGTTNTLTKVTGIFPYNIENGTQKFLVTDSSVTLETADFKTWVFVSSGSNTSSFLSWIQVRNKMWGFNGVDAVKTWDGSTQQILDGTKGLPNVPKFKYGQYYQDRVWGFNINNAASDLDFSDLTTTSAIIINPDDPRAWPSTNNLKVGQGDGEIGTAMWVAGGQLRLGKERSIHTLYGTSVTNYFIRKEMSNTNGIVSNDSIVNQDNFTYSMRQDGIYENEKRISDLIQPDIELIDKGVQKTITDSWETKADFDKGYYYGTEGTNDGTLSLKSTIVSGSALGTSPIPTFGFVTYSNGALDGTSPPALTPATTFYGQKQVKFSASSAIQTSHKIWNKKALWTYSSPSGSCFYASMTFINNITKERYKADGVDQSGGGLGQRWLFTFSSNVIMDGFDLLNSSMAVKLEGCGYTPSDISLGIAFQFINATTGQYISDIATSTTITAWGNFDSVRTPNGGSINYFFRSGTAPVNVTTQTWQSISPGSVINANTNNLFKQWAATITAVSYDEATQIYVSTANIDNVEISHIEGSGAFTRAFGIGWKNRYWLCTTTNTSTNLKVIYVKSLITNDNPNAWMPIEGINILSFARTPNILYGGSATDGSVYRMDYGSDFNGSPIPRVYDTPDFDAGDHYFSKNLYGYLIHTDRDSGLTLTLGTSIDFGNFTYKSISLDGSGSIGKYILGVKNPFKFVRVRFYNNQLDKLFNIDNFRILATPTGILEQK